MAFLGLFSKRDKNKAQDVATQSSYTSTTSDVDPSEPDYVLPPSSKSNSIYSGPVGASSSKLMLGFKAKKSPVTRTDRNLLSPPSSAFLSTRSESEHNLSPPPPRSAVFAGYNDPNSAFSTRSLPTHPTAHSRTNSKELVDLGSGSQLSPPQKNGKGGLFSWAHRERKKSKPPPPPTSLAPAPLPSINLDSDSFNLRAFRHVRPESPNDPAPVMLPPVRPRPREGSFASDTSQRISVAAFREAQARRSTANSPVPSSSRDVTSPSPSGGLRPPSSFALRSSKSVSGESDTEESDEEDDSEASSTLRPRRNRSTKPQKSSEVVTLRNKSVSELGHKTVHANANPPPPPRMAASTSSNGSFGQGVPPPKESPYARPRASASTSALQPSIAARRASLLLAQQKEHQRVQAQEQGKPALPPAASAARPAPQKARTIPRPSSLSSSSSASSSSDSDSDTPLATLVGPKRPGSAASSAPSSASRPRAGSRLPPKPLIDITGIAPPPSMFAEPDRPPVPPKASPQSASSPQTSIPGYPAKPSLNDRLTRLAKSAPSASRSADSAGEQDSAKESDKKRGMVRRTPTRSQTQPIEAVPFLASDSPSPMHRPLRKVNGRSMSSPNAAVEDVRNQAESAPIIPTPIRTRTPPPAFAVTSRPPSQFSLSQNQPSQSSQQPGPRASEETVRVSRARASTVASDGDLVSGNGFTGGGLLAGVSSLSSSSSLVPGRTRQRSSTMVSPSTLPLSSPQSASPAQEEARSRSNVRPYQTSSRDLVPPRPIGRSSSPVSSKSSAYTSTPPSSSSRSTFAPKSAMKTSSSQSVVSENTRPRAPSHTSGTLSSFPAPSRPFAGSSYTVALRGNSPASSTGDSSSGRTPITPLDGSDIASAASAKKRGHRKSSSVTFDEPDRGRPGVRERSRERAEPPFSEESKRRERRRSEAKAAIELGKIVNGRGPVITDDDDGVLGNVGPRMFNPTIATNSMGSMGALNVTPATPLTWTPQATSPPGMMNPMFPMGQLPQNADPNFLVAHQQAMMAAKQAFQIAYAQQALAAANEEWERGSTAASAYGGFGGGSMMPPAAAPGFGMGMNMGMGGMSMGMPWQMQMFPSSQSMYAGSVIGGSELGVNTGSPGRGGGAGWSSRTAYGEQGSYQGSSAQRASMAFRNSQLLGGGMSGARSEVGGPTSPRGGGGQRARTKTNPSDAPLPPSHAKGRGGPPPSSWNVRGNRPA